MKDYELSVLIHPDLEMNPDPVIDKVKKIIDQVGGTISNEDNQGKKRLSYPIKGQNFALYYYADISLPSDAPDKISTNLNISDEIIRYLLVRTDERKAKYAARRAEAEANRAPREENSNNKEDE
ncbi:30S ribosomal protein S6 [Candidatus Saccharibacteria bacterium]|nr:30S ribosomal protein S6 [Candidatus Saccharibacteria bacterium]